jgi:flagellar biosynthesis protein FlhF
MTQVQNNLHMKTYFSSTVEAAVDLARRELGSEAMLVDSRPAPEEVRHLGRYEVIFATGGPLSESPEPVSKPAPRPQSRVVEPFLPQKMSARKPPAAAAASDTHLQLEDIRLQLTTIRQSLWTSRPETESATSASDSSLFRRLLESSGVDSALARELVHSVVRQVPAPSTREQFRAALAEEMENRIETVSTLHSDTQTESSPRRILALTGPPGRGKSTTLVKLAISQGLARRCAVRILSMDNYRVGASEQMRCYAAILGVSFHACQTIGELDLQLANTWGLDGHKPSLTLIDTSGYAPADLEEAAELAAYFSARPEINVHLVLRADAKSADSISAVQRYSHFGVSRLIFAGMDEAETFGSVFTTAAQTAKPVSFLGTGQRIPEDLEPAVKSGLIQLVLGGKESTVSAAA